MCSGSCWVLAEGKELKLKKTPLTLWKVKIDIALSKMHLKIITLWDFVVTNSVCANSGSWVWVFFPLFANVEVEQEEFGVWLSSRVWRAVGWGFLFAGVWKNFSYSVLSWLHLFITKNESVEWNYPVKYKYKPINILFDLSSFVFFPWSLLTS